MYFYYCPVETHTILMSCFDNVGVKLLMPHSVYHQAINCGVRQAVMEANIKEDFCLYANILAISNDAKRNRACDYFMEF